MIKKQIKNYAGLTFIEMMMAIAIFVIGMEGFTLLFAKTWKTNSYTIEMGQSSLAVSQGLSRMVDYIRRARQGDDGSYPLKSGDDNSLIIFCDFDKDGVTERLHFYKNGEDILMGVTRPTATLPKTYPVGDQELRTIASHIVNDASAPVFSYFNKDYPTDTTNNPLATPILADSARLIKIYLEINIKPGSGLDNTHMQSYVEMRNLNDYNRIQ
jgi:hypothetical protein